MDFKKVDSSTHTFKVYKGGNYMSHFFLLPLCCSIAWGTQGRIQLLIYYSVQVPEGTIHVLHKYVFIITVRDAEKDLK